MTNLGLAVVKGGPKFLCRGRRLYTGPVTEPVVRSCCGTEGSADYNTVDSPYASWDRGEPKTEPRMQEVI